jgi:hypothetical protein
MASFDQTGVSMPLFEISLIIVVSSLLIIAVMGLHHRRVKSEAGEGRKSYAEGPAQISHAVDPPARAPKRRITMMATVDAPPVAVSKSLNYVPPAGSLMYEQLEVGQTIKVLTETATYILTLRDALARRFETVRVGLTQNDTVAEEAFEILFRGCHLPYHGYVHGWFVLGGRMTFLKARAGVVYGFSTSTQIIAINQDVPSRQAS